MMRRSILLASLVALAWRPAIAAPPAQGDDEIIVQGRKLSREDITKVVRSIGHPEETGGFAWQYPRWADRVCVLVGGFPQDGGQFIADRIGEVARTLKLDAGQPGCAPNIFVLATDDPSKLIAKLRLKRHGLIEGPDIDIVEHIQHSHDAVRWIGATGLSGAYGSPTQASDQGLAGHSTTQVNSYDGGSRIETTTQTYLTRETIVVDGTQLDGISYEQLADYLAFVALAQLNPHASAPGIDSILSLFPRGGSAPTGLTAFDKAYLVGLYQMNPNAFGTLQRHQMESSISQTLRKASATEAAPQP